jgi:hypothetical protein
VAPFKYWATWCTRSSLSTRGTEVRTSCPPPFPGGATLTSLRRRRGGARPPLFEHGPPPPPNPDGGRVQVSTPTWQLGAMTKTCRWCCESCGARGALQFAGVSFLLAPQHHCSLVVGVVVGVLGAQGRPHPSPLKAQASQRALPVPPLILVHVPTFPRASGLTPRDVHAVAATSGPGLAMCLRVGLTAAQGIAQAAGVPLLDVNHLEVSGRMVGGGLLPPA